MKYFAFIFIFVSVILIEHDHKKCKWKSIDFAKIAKEAAAKTDDELKY